MKKLFLSLLALVAMVVTANAQRAWAYDLSLTSESESYTFTFKATTAATATLILSDEEGNNVGTLDLGAVVAGSNTFTYTTDQLPKAGKMNWAVKLEAGAIANIVEVTDQSRGIYDFYNMMDVLVDNNPESEYFGKIYIQMALNGGSDGSTERAKTQKAGLFIYDQNLNELNPTSNVGIQPTLPEGYTMGDNRNKFHRLEIDPKTGKLAYCYNVAGSPAVFAIDRANLTGTVENLLAGVGGLNQTCALAFDAEGTLYVMNLANSAGAVYKIVDGQAVAMFKPTGKFVNSSMSMAADGMGGLWIAQNRGQLDGYYQLAHMTSAGVIDWSVYDDLGTFVQNKTPGTSSTGWTGGAARGALAYDAERKLLAQGRNSVVEVYSVAYDAETGVPTLTLVASTPTVGTNIDGLHFDYAGDLYVVNSSKEKFQKFAMPTENNVCTTPAPKAQVIINSDEVVLYTITATVNDETMGTVSGAGKYYEGETVTLKATPKTGHEFVNWSNGVTEATLTFVAEKDSTIVANFKKMSYTVTAIVNDELKGTISGTGTYEYGETVTLEATPAEGYELLYWSDRSTENPRTVTVDGNKVLNAYFVKEYDKEPTFKVEKLWENTTVPAATGNGYQAVGWDGAIYMQDNGNDVVWAYTSATDSAFYTASPANSQQIAVDNAGNLVLRNTNNAFYNTTNSLLIIKKGEKEGKVVDFTPAVTGRSDFFSASGDLFSAEGGYVYIYCQDKTTVERVYIKNGAATAEDIVVDAVGSAITAGNSQNHVMVDIFGNLAAHSRSNGVSSINVHNNASSKTFAATLSGIKLSTLGGCTFELGGKEFWAYNVGTTAYNSEWNIYNMTDKKFLSEETFYAKNKTEVNSAANWLNVQVVDEKTAYIYQFCPKVAVAVWKVTCDTGEEPGTGTAVDNTNVAPQVQKIIRDGQVLIIRDGKTFNMMGQEVR